MSDEPIHAGMRALAQGIRDTRPWWNVQVLSPFNGPPGAGVLEVRAQLWHSGQYRRLRIWFRLGTSAPDATALLERLLLDRGIANEVELFAWECRQAEASDARPGRRRR